MFGIDPETVEIVLYCALTVMVGLIAWAAVTINKHRMSALSEADSKFAGALEQSSKTSAQLLDKLDDIDGRLKSVEKTLNEIP